jgi:hypothetical protein
MESIYNRRHPTILEGLAQGRAAGGMSALKLPTHRATPWPPSGRAYRNLR